MLCFLEVVITVLTVGFGLLSLSHLFFFVATEIYSAATIAPTRAVTRVATNVKTIVADKHQNRPALRRAVFFTKYLFTKSRNFKSIFCIRKSLKHTAHIFSLFRCPSNVGCILMLSWFFRVPTHFIKCILVIF